MKKIFTALTLTVLLCSCAYAYNLSGDTYIIESYSDFTTLMQDTSITASGKYFLLSRDIQLAGYSNWPGIGTEDDPFNGHFDGGGHTIYVNIQPLPGLSSTYRPIAENRALFTHIKTTSGYAVRNLKVEGSVRVYNAG